MGFRIKLHLFGLGIKLGFDRGFFDLVIQLRFSCDSVWLDSVVIRFMYDPIRFVFGHVWAWSIRF